MCEFIDYRKDGTKAKIKIEFDRDASFRRHEVVIINHDRYGNEVDGLRIYCDDRGKIQVANGPVVLLDGEDF